MNFLSSRKARTGRRNAKNLADGYEEPDGVGLADTAFGVKDGESVTTGWRGVGHSFEILSGASDVFEKSGGDGLTHD